MADLSKTSRISVLLDILLVAIVARYSPTSESIADAGGIITIISRSTFRPRTCFVGLGVISFAFSCQHSCLIIAGSLEKPTRERWGKVTLAAVAGERNDGNSGSTSSLVSGCLFSLVLFYINSTLSHCPPWISVACSTLAIIMGTFGYVYGFSIADKLFKVFMDQVYSLYYAPIF